MSLEGVLFVCECWVLQGLVLALWCLLFVGCICSLDLRVCTTWSAMSVVIHVRVPRRLKERLEELSVDISEEVRRLLEERAASLSWRGL